MEINSKDDIKGLSLQELKIICADYKINKTGTKAELIKKIWEHVKPEPIVINTHPASVSPAGKKMVGVKLTDSERQRQIGIQRQKDLVNFIYYSMGVHYYEVDKDFEFL